MVLQCMRNLDTEFGHKLQPEAIYVGGLRDVLDLRGWITDGNDFDHRLRHLTAEQPVRVPRP